MAQRRFGPTLGPGTVVIESEGQKQISPSQLGTTCHVGVYQKGKVGEVIECLRRGDFDTKCGGRIPDSTAPDAGQDFFSLASGAGELDVIRVTDGDELSAERTFYTRHDDADPGAGSFLNGAVPSLKVTAHSPGRWAGTDFLYDQEVADTDVTATTVDLGLPAGTLGVDQLKGAVMTVEDIAGKSYVCTGNDDAGLCSFESHNDIASDWPSGSPSVVFLWLDGSAKNVSVVFGNGVENPTTEFSMVVYEDGDEVRTYENLSMDPTSGRYVENVVNNDGLNFWVEVEVQWSGGVTALARPTNCWRGESTALTDPSDSDPDLLTAEVTAVSYDAGNTGDGTGSVTSFTDEYLEDELVFECTTLGGDAVGKFKVTSTIYGTSADDVVTSGTEYVTGTRGVGVTLVGGLTDWAVGDKVTVKVYRLATDDELVGGYLYPDIDGNPNDSFRIIGNSGNTIRVAVGSDLGSVATVGDTFSVEAPQRLQGGADGIGGLKSNLTPFVVAFDTATSPINDLRGKGKGLVKIATPGLSKWAEDNAIGSLGVLVHKAGLSYAESRAYQYRVEVPPATTGETAADTYVNSTVGKNDFGVVSFPSYCYVLDPDSTDGALKVLPMTGMIHGREAGVARNYNGYHKAAAGIEVTLPRVLKLTTGNTVLNEEYLNPRGLNVIKKVAGNFVLWGDRTIASDPTWKWKHQREQMSHYILSLLESFDWIIWALNDETTWQLAYAALYSFFLPEWNKRALRGDNFEDACSIKVDKDINTDASMAQGDLNAQVSLRLADVVERMIITLGKKGIFEEAA